jgi:hypothetical protein
MADRSTVIRPNTAQAMCSFSLSHFHPLPRTVMLRGARLSGRRLPGPAHYRTNKPASSSLPLPHFSQNRNISSLVRPSRTSQRRAPVRLPHYAFAASAISARMPPSCATCSSLLPVAPPHPRALAPCSCSFTRVVERAALLYWCWWCRLVPQVVGPGRAKGTHKHGLCWWCSLATGSHPKARINQLWPSLSYVAMYVSSVSDIC